MKARYLISIIVMAAALTACGTKEVSKDNTEKKEEVPIEDTEIVDDFVPEMEADFVGIWIGGTEEDERMLILLGDGFWYAFWANQNDELLDYTGEVTAAEDSLRLMSDGEEWDSIFFGEEENTLYSNSGYTYELLTNDADEMLSVINEMFGDSDESVLFGTWTTGENEDTRYIQIYEDSTWEVLNVDELDGWEEIGGQVKTTEDSYELYNGNELYDTVFFGAEEDTLYSANDYTYVRVVLSVPEDYVGVWETGANEDLSYLIILADGTWMLVSADANEDEEAFGGTAEVTEDALELYNEGELYTAVFFGAEENTLYCTFENTFVLVSRDFNEIGD